MKIEAKNISALAVAEYFILKANESGVKTVTNKKLQKLVYYAQAWSLAINDRKLFEDKIEAWVHGPAVRELYSEYKNHGFSSIKKGHHSELINTIKAEDISLLDNVWNVYGKFDADYLELLTHSEDPWIIARADLSETDGSDNEISVEIMRDFYKAKISA
jgi:uncharacterized phage-associated protein